MQMYSETLFSLYVLQNYCHITLWFPTQRP